MLFLFYTSKPLLRTFLIMLLTVLSSNNLYAKPVIHWAKYDFAPYFISKGPYADIGIADKLYSLLQANLPNYQHQTYLENVPRIIRNLKEDKATCTSLTKKAGREQLMYYSSKAILIPNQTLQLLTQDVDRVYQKLNIQQPESISLKSLLVNHPNIRLGLKQQRSYGSDINQILSQHKAQSVFFSSVDSVPHMFNLLHKKRIDFIIEYPAVSYFALKAKKLDTPITSINIIENANKSIFSYIVCSKNPAGEKAIQAINTVIAQKAATKQYRDIAENWLPKSSITNYRKRYQEHMLD